MLSTLSTCSWSSATTNLASVSCRKYFTSLGPPLEKTPVMAPPSACAASSAQNQWGSLSPMMAMRSPRWKPRLFSPREKLLTR